MDKQTGSNKRLLTAMDAPSPRTQNRTAPAVTPSPNKKRQRRNSSKFSNSREKARRRNITIKTPPLTADITMEAQQMTNEEKSREVWLKEEVHNKVCDTRRGIRLAIGMYYLQVLGSPPKKEWDGRHGTVAHICEIWDIPLKL